MKDFTLAALVLKGMAERSPGQRRMVAKWLRKQANWLEEDGHLYHKQFKARYLLREKP